MDHQPALILGSPAGTLKVVTVSAETEQPSPCITNHSPKADSHTFNQLPFCVLGLQASYLTWGYVQEKVMTKEYNTGQFPSAGFCVFSNRVLAVIVACVVTLCKHRTIRMPAPILLFLPASISNCFSSFAQYQALRYISFPLQTLAKSAKVIPVMIMGKFLNQTSYSWKEYMQATVISAGMTMFSFSEGSDLHGQHTQMLGAFMLSLYIASDSFTSQWQARVFKNNSSVDHFQMMFAVNAWSFVLTFGALITSNEFLPTIGFLVANPEAILDNLTIAVTSATGQIFIFYTLRQFGPVVFAITMMTRQIISFVLSAIFFGHSFGDFAYCGAVMVFATGILQIYGRSRHTRAVNANNKSSNHNCEQPDPKSAEGCYRQVSA